MLKIPPLDGSREYYMYILFRISGVLCKKPQAKQRSLVMIIVVLFSDVIGQLCLGCIRAILRVFMNIFGV